MFARKSDGKGDGNNGSGKQTNTPGFLNHQLALDSKKTEFTAWQYRQLQNHKIFAWGIYGGLGLWQQQNFHHLHPPEPVMGVTTVLEIDSDYVITGHKCGTILSWNIKQRSATKCCDVSFPILSLEKEGEKSIYFQASNAKNWTNNFATKKLAAANSIPKQAQVTLQGIRHDSKLSSWALTENRRVVYQRARPLFGEDAKLIWKNGEKVSVEISCQRKPAHVCEKGKYIFLEYASDPHGQLPYVEVRRFSDFSLLNTFNHKAFPVFSYQKNQFILIDCNTDPQVIEPVTPRIGATAKKNMKPG